MYVQWIFDFVFWTLDLPYEVALVASSTLVIYGTLATLAVSLVVYLYMTRYYRLVGR